MQVINVNTVAQDQVINQATQVLKQGGLVIYPTETVYGVAVDATQQPAVDKLLRYKSRREGKPLSIAVSSRAMAEKYAQLNQQAQQLYQQFLPGPYTIISQVKSNSGLATGVASEFGTIGVRIPDYPLILELVKTLGKPITATSANASGKKRPYIVDDIFQHLSQSQKDRIDLVLDTGRLPPNEPSTVIDTTLSTPLTVRSSQRSRFGSGRKLEFESQSPQETQQIAGKLLLKHWEQIKESGLLVGLNGPLGAGKTVFAKGIAQFLNIDQTITSPTYTYLKEYAYQRHQTSGKFCHLDLWRIDQAQELAGLKLNQLVQPQNVIAVEWWSQIHPFLDQHPQLQQQALVIEFNLDQPEDGFEPLAPDNDLRKLIVNQPGTK